MINIPGDATGLAPGEAAGLAPGEATEDMPGEATGDTPTAEHMTSVPMYLVCQVDSVSITEPQLCCLARVCHWTVVTIICRHC